MLLPGFGTAGPEHPELELLVLPVSSGNEDYYHDFK